MKVSNFAIISRVYRNFKKHLLKPIPTEIKSILSHNPPRSSRLSSSSTSQRRCLRSRTPPARWRRGQRRSYPENEVRSRGMISCMRGDGRASKLKKKEWMTPTPWLHQGPKDGRESVWGTQAHWTSPKTC